MTFNPKSARYLGLEWPVIEEVKKRVANSGTALCQMFKAAAATEDIATLITPVALSRVAGSMKLGVDIYSTPDGTLPTGVVAGWASGDGGNYPSTDTGSVYTGLSGAAWVTDSGAAATYAAINEFVTTDYLKNTQATDDAHLLVRVSSATVDDWRGSFRYLRTYIEVLASSSMASSPRLNACLDLAGVRYYGPDYYLDPALGVQTIRLHTWGLNPATGLPWTMDEVNDLTLNVTDEFGLRARWSNEAADGLRIYGIRLGFEWIPDLRVAYGSVDLTAGATTSYATSITLASRPNLLRRANSDFDDVTNGIGTWAAETNCAVSRNTGTVKDGAGSMRLLSSANGNMSAILASPTLAQLQGPRTYEFQCWLRAGTSARTCFVEAYNVDTGAIIATGTAAADSNAGWTAFSVSFTLASGLVTVGFRVQVNSTGGGGGEAHYVDSCMLCYDDCGATFVAVGSEAAYWHKVQDTSYLVVFRRISGNGSFHTDALKAALEDCPHLSHHVVNMAIVDESGQLGIATYNAELSGLPLHFRTAGPATSTDSQIYGLLNMDGSAFGIISQEITAPGTGTYSAIGLVVASTLTTDAALTVNLKRRSDNVTVATATITRAMLNSTPDEAQYVVASFASAVVLTAQQYYVNIDLTGTGWQIGRLAELYTTTGASAGFGGTTDIASWLNEASQSSASDYVAVLRPAIPAPASMTATRVDA